eukprot:CAMPEP_0172452096 /NCGR_PEP_ID=MMETSP1065-20121228/9860_1 /TAXON_ID=265537 /ORGANISM="Amphiprora paludosa, Strain CCMP125" /LENGTH=41 /DNA_ID= /DNA_START= /DNA_END= /DNA_ORIENTATION=
MAVGATTSLGLGEVGGIAVDAEDHVTGLVADDGIRVGAGVV